MLSGMRKHFNKPTTVWKLKDGYFAEFNKGKIGGVFCYADNEMLTWVQLIDPKGNIPGIFVSQVMKLDEETYVLAGGNPDMNIGYGDIYVVNFKDKEPQIKRHVVSRVSSGVPTLCGLSQDLIVTEDSLAVYSVAGHENKNDQLYGISKFGMIYHLGKYSVKRTRELQLEGNKEKMETEVKPQVKKEEVKFVTIEQDAFLAIIRGRDLPHLYKPYIYQEGRFPKARLQAELEEIDDFIKHLEIDRPVLLKNLMSKRVMTKAELVVAVRMGRWIKDSIANETLQKSE